jgi:uncharacterized protein YjdB
MFALHRIRRAIAPLIVAFGVAACTDASEPPQLTQLSLSVPSPTVVTGQTVAVTPLPIDQFGVSMPPATIEWRSTATSIATVSASGMLTGVAPGTVSIVATAGAITGQIPITVVGATLTSLTVTIPSLALAQGQTAAATANGLDQLNRPLAIGRVTWASSSPTVATVDSLGGVRVPSGALLSRDGKPHVAVVDGQGRLHFVAVQLDRTSDRDVVIRGGLDAGAKVVMPLSSLLREGVQVNIAP